jgi:DNA-binding response OmpR family regulator
MPTTPRILVVDDEPDICTLLRRLLESADYQVETALDGGTALSRVGEGFDLMLLDVMMPGLNGLQVCRRVRANEQGTYLPILMLTALGGEEHCHAGFAAGADDYITKPFSNHELLDRVQVWLRAGQRFRAEQTATAAREERSAGLRPPAAGRSIEEQVLQVEGLLHYLVREAQARPGFLAALLIPYSQAQGWDEEELAQQLGCPLGTLARLLLRPRPLPLTWATDVKIIADAYGVNATALGTVLREAEAWERRAGVAEASEGG